jgi:hypothetical protein
MFWGGVWDEYMRAGGDPSSLDLTMRRWAASTPGWALPILSSRSTPSLAPAISSAKLLPRGVEILARHGVPSNIASNSPPVKGEPVLLGVAALVAAAALAIAARRRTRRSGRS